MAAKNFIRFKIKDYICSRYTAKKGAKIYE